MEHNEEIEMLKHINRSYSTAVGIMLQATANSLVAEGIQSPLVALATKQEGWQPSLYMAIPTLDGGFDIISGVGFHQLEGDILKIAPAIKINQITVLSGYPKQEQKHFQRLDDGTN